MSGPGAPVLASQSRDVISRDRGQQVAVGRDGQGIPHVLGVEQEMRLARPQVPRVNPLLGECEEGAFGRIQARVLDRPGVPIARVPQAPDEASGRTIRLTLRRWQMARHAATRMKTTSTEMPRAMDLMMIGPPSLGWRCLTLAGDGSLFQRADHRRVRPAFGMSRLRPAMVYPPACARSAMLSTRRGIE